MLSRVNIKRETKACVLKWDVYQVARIQEEAEIARRDVYTDCHSLQLGQIFDHGDEPDTGQNYKNSK